MNETKEKFCCDSYIIQTNETTHLFKFIYALRFSRGLVNNLSASVIGALLDLQS